MRSLTQIPMQKAPGPENQEANWSVLEMEFNKELKPMEFWGKGLPTSMGTYL